MTPSAGRDASGDKGESKTDKSAKGSATGKDRQVAKPINLSGRSDSAAAAAAASSAKRDPKGTATKQTQKAEQPAAKSASKGTASAVSTSPKSTPKPAATTTTTTTKPASTTKPVSGSKTESKKMSAKPAATTTTTKPASTTKSVSGSQTVSTKPAGDTKLIAKPAGDTKLSSPKTTMKSAAATAASMTAAAAGAAASLAAKTGAASKAAVQAAQNHQQQMSATTSATTTPAGAAASTPTAATSSGSQTRAAMQTRPGVRQLTLSKVDPWSVMKLSFLMSIGIGIMIVVASSVLWMLLNGMGVFDKFTDILKSIDADGQLIDPAVFGFGRTLSLATVVAVMDVILLTALSTLCAVLYNLGSRMVGGLRVTLTDQ